jgi:hypothetical protein
VVTETSKKDIAVFGLGSPQTRNDADWSQKINNPVNFCTVPQTAVCDLAVIPVRALSKTTTRPYVFRRSSLPGHPVVKLPLQSIGETPPALSFWLWHNRTVHHIEKSLFLA